MIHYEFPFLKAKNIVLKELLRAGGKELLHLQVLTYSVFPFLDKNSSADVNYDI